MRALDAATVERPAALLGAASAAGFGRELAVRQRTGDLTVGSDAAPTSIAAASTRLQADAGRVDVTGRIAGVAGAASSVALSAGDRVVLGAGTTIVANGGVDGSDAGQGGRVVLSARNGFSFGPGARVSVAPAPAAGPTGADGGSIELRFDASAASTVLQSGSARPTLESPGGRIVLTGVQNLTAGATLGQTQIDATRSASDAFVAQRDTLVATLGLPVDATVVARPELVFTGAPDTTLTVNRNINLATYRSGGIAGVLTIRSLADLEISGQAIVSSRGLSAVISDGFTDGGARSSSLTDPQGWSLRLVAGADASAAHPMSVGPAASGGDLNIGADRAIRTSTGDISLAAARDVRIGQPTGSTPTERDAAVYTAGTPASTIAAFDLPLTAQRPTYLTRGGDVRITAGRDVVGAEANQLASNWLFRRGTVDASGNVPVRRDANGNYVYAGTSWGPRIDAFRQGVAALGGGDVAVTAGRDVSNVSVSVPTNARFYGPSDRSDPAAANQSSTVLGGGSVSVEAGRDVIAGSVTMQRGTGTLRAGRSITTGRDVFGTDTGTIVAVGDASLTVEAGATARVDRAVDPTMLPQPSGATRTYFSTQGADTRLVIRAAGGDASLRSEDNSAVSLFAITGLSTLTGDMALSAAFGPHTLSIEALTRDVIVGNVDVRLAANARGDLRLLAARNVTGNAANGFAPSTVMLDYDPTVFFSPRAPVPESVIDLTAPYTRVVGGARLGAAVPLHAGDSSVARIYAGSGDVAHDPTSATAWQIETAKPVEVRAGRDVANLALAAKHPDPTDRSVIYAGRDIVSPVPRTATNEIATGGSRVRIGGAGLVELIAGRDIKLGSGAGVETRGNLDDTALPVDGASIVMVAGLPDGPDYRAFLDAYVAPAATRGRGYDTELATFLKSVGVRADALDAGGRWAALGALPGAQQAAFARLVFFTELRDAARAAADPASPTVGNYQRAYDAVATLFPKDGKGNIELVFSKIRTERGGDIQLLAPGEVCRGASAGCGPGEGGTFVGNIVAGLLTPQPVRSASRLSPTDFGILTLGGGSIQGVAGNDVAVNQSRVFTVGGGDILLWSSYGDIDAGRGSRTAIASPPPVVTVDPQGNIRVEVPGAASGSGIGTLITRADVAPGSVDLYAPKGAIDAGEAGIRVSGSAFLGASEIRNAGAISAAGPSVGVPTASSASNVSLASAGTSAASATKSAGDAAERDAADAASRQRTASRVLILEFLGFGDEGEEAYRRRQQRGR
ncbi:MAG: filamentous hemagglutinin family protein [Burkholderiales bacterium]